jgi:hypothetical protein
MIRKKIEADYSVLLRLIFLSIVFLAVVFVVQSQFTLGWMMYFFISFVAFLILVFLLQLYRPFLEALKQR